MLKSAMHRLRAKLDELLGPSPREQELWAKLQERSALHLKQSERLLAAHREARLLKKELALQAVKSAEAVRFSDPTGAISVCMSRHVGYSVYRSQHLLTEEFCKVGSPELLMHVLLQQFVAFMEDTENQIAKGEYATTSDQG